MPSIPLWLQALPHQAPRKYAQWRLGVTAAEARAHNTTDRVLLTFDDYGDTATIEHILDILAREKVKAVFFLQGDWAQQHADLVRRIAAAGHWLGNHSYSHPHLPLLSTPAVRSEIQKGLAGTLLRPPYGEYNHKIRAIAKSLGLKIAFWTIDSGDWRGHSAQKLQRIILPRLHKGACILLHLNAPHTVEALPGLIAGIRARGLELCHEGNELAI